MPRLQPPKDFLNLKDAVQFLRKQGLNVTEGMIYRYVKTGRLVRHGAESRKQKYYSIAELKKLADEELALHNLRIRKDTDIVFAPATIEDLAKITELSAKLFRTATLRPISTETRRAWFDRESRGHYVIKRSGGELVAYIHILPLADERIAEYMNDEIRGRDITGDDVQPLEPGHPVSCIVASIGSDPDIEDSALRHRHTSILLRGVGKEFTELGKKGIIIPRLYAYSESKSGILMSVRMRMKQYADPVGNRFTFWLDILRSPMRFLRGYQRALGDHCLHFPEHALSLAQWQQHAHPGDEAWKE